MRSTLRTVLVTLLLLAAGLLLTGYLSGFSYQARPEPPGLPEGTSGAVERARERGADIGEKAAIATEKAEEAVSEAALTAKIKAKMALDDSVRAAGISVRTQGSTVTLSGLTTSTAEHERAVQLARETDGVTRVVDHIEVK